MKIFQITQLNESPQKASRLADKILSKWNTVKSGAGQEQPADLEYRSADDLIADVVEKVLSGEAKLSKDIDAELGKTAVDPVDMHREIRNKIINAAESAATKINDQVGTDPSSKDGVQSDVELNLLAAAYGYINKKYNNGPDNVDPNDGPEIVVKAVQSNQPKGGQQPIGRVSSSRPNGQQGTVSSGGGTNALDAMAANSQDF
jgi:hypothetical protein